MSVRPRGRIRSLGDASQLEADRHCHRERDLRPSAIRFFRAEGKRYWDSFRFERKHVKRDLAALLLLTVALAPVTYLPNMLLAL